MYREIFILQNQIDHPNIVKYYQTFESKSYIYLVTELCEKGTLMDQIDSFGSMAHQESESL
jgi:calcium-dependent protein kinase